MITALNNWYNNLERTKRFFVFVIPMIIAIICINTLSLLPFGLLLFSLMGMWAGTRAISKRGLHAPVGFALVGSMLVTFILSLFLLTLMVLKLFGYS